MSTAAAGWSLFDPPGLRGGRATADRGTDGAIMILGVFMAMFLVGMLYYVKGLGETALYRERMQDAADATSFAAAVMHARGMNIIVFINIIMAAVLAILVVLRAVELLCIGGIALAAALAWPTGGASLAAIPPLNTVRQIANTAYNQAEPIVMNILRAGHKAEIALRNGVPYVAEGRAVWTVMESYRPPAVVGFVYPFNRPLPTQDAPYSELCDRARQFATDLIILPFQRIGVPGFIISFIRGAVDGINRMAAATVCGGGGTLRPSFPGVDFSKPLPETELSRQCQETGDSTTCSQASQEIQRMQYDPTTGNCADNVPSGADRGMCQSRIARATTQCQPGGSRRTFRYTYQVAQMRYTIRRLRDGSVVRDVPALDTDVNPNPRVVTMPDAGRPMCGVGGTVSTTYGSPGLLCEPTQEDRERGVNVGALMPDGPPAVVRFQRVMNVLGCRGEADPIETTVPPSDSGGDDRSPQRIKDNVYLGDDNFQLRGFVFGNTDFNASYKGVRVANAGREGSSTSSSVFYGLTQSLGRLSVAQAEFYWDGEDNRDEWMWQMRWRARLRRFRVPQGLDGGRLTRACNQGSAAGSGSSSTGCGSAGGLDLRMLENVVVH